LPHPVFQKGFTLGGWSSEDYSRPELEAQLKELHAAGVEWVALTPRWFQETLSSQRIHPDQELSPTDESLRRLIRLARARGLRVLLKPQIDLLKGGWRGDVKSSSEDDWARWFESYNAFISHYAKLAAESGVSLLSIGVELDATRHRTQDWRRIISTVRELYAGPLVYAANWGRERDIEWWDDLDYAGVDAYFPVASHPDPSLAEVQSGWAAHIDRLRAWAQRIEKPVIFTEIGYRSIAGAGSEPWEWERSGPASVSEQAVLYEAAMSSLWSEPWLCRFYWWQWRTSPPANPKSDAGFTP